MRTGQVILFNNMYIFKKRFGVQPLCFEAVQKEVLNASFRAH